MNRESLAQRLEERKAENGQKMRAENAECGMGPGAMLFSVAATVQSEALRRAGPFGFSGATG
jgi:hypothetical protein